MLRPLMLCFVAVTAGCASARAWDSRPASSPYEAAERRGREETGSNDDGRFAPPSEITISSAPDEADAFSSFFGGGTKDAEVAQPTTPPPPKAPPLQKPD